MAYRARRPIAPKKSTLPRRRAGSRDRLRDGRRSGNTDRFQHTAFLLRICNVVDLLPEEYNERIRPLELFPLRFLVLRWSKMAIVSPTR